ncbi:hypothetical protein Y1Q_0008228 [Alligator mississippiensis]|uniref:Uncharacterized protein n=1 Tax=Alligator mississippiensis TaxID=8496 RepID=A0A151N1D1_ALLMI|nr:hypothetical protein Y1Q_0008228 [Alligator mississippiensis]
MCKRASQQGSDRDIILHNRSDGYAATAIEEEKQTIPGESLGPNLFGPGESCERKELASVCLKGERNSDFSIGHLQTYLDGMQYINSSTRHSSRVPG